MTLPDWRLKQGTDWTAPNDVIVKVAGVAQDLRTGWDLASWTMFGNASSSSHVEFAIDDDSTLLEEGRVRLSLTRTQTAAMKPGRWKVDVQATSTETGRQKSETFNLEVVDAVTETE